MHGRVLPDEAHNAISADAANRQGANHLKRVLECCPQCGRADALRPVLSGARPVYGCVSLRRPNSKARQLYTAPSLPVAEAAGVKCAIEALNRFEAHLLNTMEQAAAYVKRVDHPNFGTMYDTFHANIEEKNPITAIDTVFATGKLNHVHISENDRGTPGRGHINIVEQIKHLKKIGYDGWMTIEAFGSALPDLAAATRVWRDFFPSTEQVYTEGYALIKNALA
jgi:D-psicose/D-tagatose/L-ribulose 3-epimerase